MFGGFAFANALDFSAWERLCGRISRRTDPGTGWVSFATFNLATVMIYYGVAFDGKDTVNPGWTGILGRKT